MNAGQDRHHPNVQHVSFDSDSANAFYVAAAQERSAGQVNFCVHQPVESSFTTEQENDSTVILWS
jgi:hypothetical protein